MSNNTPQTVTAVDIKGSKREVSVSDLRWRPSAYGIVIKDNCLLVSKQFGGFDLPGGGVDLGEMPEEATIREVKEETGIDVANPVLVGLTSNFFQLPHSAKGEFIQSLMIYYVCDFVGGEFSIDGFDVQIYGEMPEWYPLDKLDELKVASSIDFRSYVRQLI